MTFTRPFLLVCADVVMPAPVYTLNRMALGEVRQIATLGAGGRDQQAVFAS